MGLSGPSHCYRRGNLRSSSVSGEKPLPFTYAGLGRSCCLGALGRLALIGVVASGASRWVSQWIELGAMTQLGLGGALFVLATVALLGVDPHHRHALRSLISALCSSKAAR